MKKKYDLRKDRADQKSLEARLSGADLVLLGLGMIIGAGIFAMPGKAVQIAGPSLVRQQNMHAQSYVTVKSKK